MTARAADVVDVVSDVVPGVLRATFPRDRYPGVCLIATRVGIETLRYFGVPAEPVVLAVMAGNRRWVEWVQTPEAVDPESMPEEAWNVSAGHQGVTLVRGIDHRTARGLDAHVAVVVGDTLLDLDAGQFARPARGIHVPPSVAVPWDGVSAGLDLDGGGVILYRAHSDPPRFRHASDWRKSAKLAGPAIRLVRDRL